MSNAQLAPLQTKPESLTELVMGAIKDAIVGQALVPGSRLSETALAAQLKVSKTPVREALLRLRHIGLVESTGSGLRVVEPSTETIRNAYELRAGLERSSALHAALRSSASDQERMAEIAAASLSCAQDGDLRGFRDADAQFHHLVARCSGNPLLATAIEDVLVLTAALRERDVPASGYSVRCAADHVGVAEAIHARDGDAAARLMAEHIQRVMSAVLAAVGAPATTTPADA